jgi:DNA-binding LytR/AlgR family response regulator
MKKSILIIEDDIEQLTMLKKLVQTVDENLEIHAVNNKAMAYRILMEKTIDVFLVDIILDTESPGDTSGIRLVEHLRQLAKYKFTPVIFITSLMDSAMYTYTALNCVDYIKKPLEPFKLLKVLKKALDYTTPREEEITLSFRKDGVLYPVRLKEIVYIEQMSHIIHIHTVNGSVLQIPYKTCKCLLQEEDVTDRLIFCDRGVLVNREYVLGIDMLNNCLKLKEGFGAIHLGQKCKKNVLAGLER